MGESPQPEVLSQWSPVVTFTADLSRRFPGTSTAIHYSSDVRLFLRWWQRSPADVQRTDIDRLIVWQQTLGRARTTINRRLVALRMWFEFQAEQASDPANDPLLPSRSTAA